MRLDGNAVQKEQRGKAAYRYGSQCAVAANLDDLAAQCLSVFPLGKIMNDFLNIFFHGLRTADGL